MRLASRHRLMKPEISFLTLALIGVLVVATGCYQIPTKGNTSPPTSPAVTTEVQFTPSPRTASPSTPAPTATQAPGPQQEAPFRAQVLGEVTTPNRFSRSKLTLFLAIENVTDSPQALLRVDGTLFDSAGRQLGTKSWGSRPIILTPDLKLPIALTFDDVTEWAKVNVAVSRWSQLASRSAYITFKTAGSAIAPSGQDIIARGSIENTGTTPGFDITVIVLGYSASGDIVAWGYAYPDQRPLFPGKQRAFETKPLQGDTGKMASQRVFVFSQIEN